MNQITGLTRPWQCFSYQPFTKNDCCHNVYHQSNEGKTHTFFFSRNSTAFLKIRLQELPVQGQKINSRLILSKNVTSCLSASPHLPSQVLLSTLPGTLTRCLQDGRSSPGRSGLLLWFYPLGSCSDSSDWKLRVGPSWPSCVALSSLHRTPSSPETLR